MSYFDVAFLQMLGLLLGVYVISVLDRLVVFRRREFVPAFISPISRIFAALRQEDLLPHAADNLLFRSAPLIALASVGLAALVIPLGPGLYAFDSSIGLFYFIAVLGPFVVAMMNAGWSQNSKVGLFGTFRAAAYLLSYEVPLGFAAIGPVMAAESLSTVRIVEAQTALWYAVWQPLGLAIYFVSALIMSYRRPFDIPQADGETGGGVLAEYSGLRLLLFTISLNAIFLLLCAMGVVLFFGGWHGPWLPAPIWFLIKTFTLAALLRWAGCNMSRLRHDQMLALAWKILLPASLVNVALVGIIVLLLR